MITSDTQMDGNYYGRKTTTAQILQGQVNNPRADNLRNTLPVA